MTDTYYQEMPEDIFRQMVEHYSTKKRLWSMGIISLPRKEIEELITVQKMTDKYHPELNNQFKKAL